MMNSTSLDEPSICTQEAAPVVWSADSVVVREGTIFSFGWCARPDSVVLGCWIDVAYRDSSIEKVAVQYGRDRPDVQRLFPRLPLACGYFVMLAFRKTSGLAAASISFEFEDGQIARYPLPLGAALGEDPASANAWDRTVAVFNDAQRAGSMVLRGQTGAVIEAFQRRRSLLGARHGGSEVLADAIELLRPRSVLMIDHMQGGGAKKFSNSLIESYLGSGRDVVIWTFMPSLLRFQVRVFSCRDGAEAKFHVTWDAHIQILSSKKISDVVFNNAVSFIKPHRVPEMLSACKNICDAHVTVYVHDFNVVCPSHFLLDFEGRFCGVPSADRCRSCLPKINDDFVNLHVTRDIDHWRALWGGALDRVDEIVCFSQSSVALIRRAYPGLVHSKITVRPHVALAPPGVYRPNRLPKQVRVGIVGYISPHKGSHVVANLVRTARALGSPIQVVIIGTLLGTASAAQCEQTGTYEPSQLTALLNSHGIDLVLMPSICPETYSFVTHEMIELNVPVLCFDLGAQAEAVSQYRLGKVVPVMDGPELVEQLMLFHQSLIAKEQVVAVV